MKDKYDKEFKDYTSISRRLLYLVANKRCPLTFKHILLYDVLWHTNEAKWKNMKSGRSMEREKLMSRLKIKDSRYLSRLLRDLQDYGFIERKYPEGKVRSKKIQVYFLAEPKEVK